MCDSDIIEHTEKVRRTLRVSLLWKLGSNTRQPKSLEAEEAHSQRGSQPKKQPKNLAASSTAPSGQRVTQHNKSCSATIVVRVPESASNDGRTTAEQRQRTTMQMMGRGIQIDRTLRMPAKRFGRTIRDYRHSIVCLSVEMGTGRSHSS